MKKPISVLSMLAMILAGVSLILAIVMLTLLWEPLCSLYSSGAIAEAGPVIPVGTVVYMIGCLIVAALVCFCAKSRKAIGLEIVSIILLIVVIPVLVRSLSMVQSIVISRTMGAANVAALSVASTIASFPSGLAGIAEALCLVVCGMSISEKIIAKKTASEANPIAE